MAKKMGRPTKEIDWNEFEKLCFFQCSILEMCEWLHVTDKTLQRRVKEQYGETFSLVFEKKRIGGIISLRRNLFKQSEKSAAVAIFLAKNFLGMSDKQEIEHSGNKDKPIIIRGVAGATRKMLSEVLNGEGTEGGNTDNTGI